MTVIQFPQRLADKLRLTIHAACNEGDMLVAERLLCVLRKHTASRPTEVDRRRQEAERIVNLQQHFDRQR